MTVIYTRRAQQDLKDIYEYISYSLLVPNTAQNIYRKIMQTANSLKDMPERFPLYKEEPWHSQGVHFVTVKKYLLLYTINSDKNEVYIVRVVYGGMDIDRQSETIDDTKQ